MGSRWIVKRRLIGRHDGQKQDPLSFLPLSEGANERSKGRVDRGIRSWRKDSEGNEPWEDTTLTEVTKDNMFDRHKVEGPRLWMPPSRDEDDYGGLQ